MNQSAMPPGDGERWLTVPGFDRYQVSNYGRIWSSYGNGRYLKPALRGAPGYERPGVILCNGPARWQAHVHQVVMLAFVGRCPEGQEVRHLDGNPFNNRWEPGATEEETRAAGGNLFYGSHAENGVDMAAHGFAKAGASRGEEHFRAKLTEDLVRQIRREYAAGGVTETVLAVRYGVNKSTLHRLLVRKTWTHVA